MRLDALFSKLRMQFDGRLIKSDFDHRKIRSRRLQEFAQREAANLELGGAEFVEAAAKMDHDEIALVPQLRKERALTVLAMFHRSESTRRFVDNFGTPAFHQGVPLRTAQTEELMQDGAAFERVGGRRDIVRGRERFGWRGWLSGHKLRIRGVAVRAVWSVRDGISVVRRFVRSPPNLHSSAPFL